MSLDFANPILNNQLRLLRGFDVSFADEGEELPEAFVAQTEEYDPSQGIVEVGSSQDAFGGLQTKDTSKAHFTDLGVDDIEGSSGDDISEDASTADHSGSAVAGVDGTYFLAQAKVTAREEKAKKDSEEEQLQQAHQQILARQREEAARMTYSDGMFHFNGMDIREEDLDAEMEESSSQSEIQAQAEKYNWDAQTTAQMTLLYQAWENASTPQEKAQIFEEMRQTGGEDWANDRAKEANERKNSSPERTLSEQERVTSVVEQIENVTEYEQIQESVAISDGYSIEEAEVHAEDLALTRSGVSSAGNPFGDTRSPNTEFNALASGNVQLAQSSPAHEGQEYNGPILAQG